MESSTKQPVLIKLYNFKQSASTAYHLLVFGKTGVVSLNRYFQLLLKAATFTQ